MKIQDSLPLKLGDTRPAAGERSTSEAASFQKMLGSFSKELTQDRLQQILQDIDVQGKQLDEKRTFHELRKYKYLVKQFMDEVAKNGVGLEQGQSWDPYGGTKNLTVIKTLNQKLLDLTNHVMNEQSKGISLLDQIGEIKGLLINLYT